MKNALFVFWIMLAVLGSLWMFMGGLIVAAFALFIAGFKGAAWTLVSMAVLCRVSKHLADQLRFY